jgi:hypothetical protein
MKHGEGIYIHFNSIKYKGTWKYNVKSGFGIIIYPNGKIINDNWIDGRRQRV